MTKVGRFVVDPKAGAYCQITLDSDEKLIVNHDKGGFEGGRVTVEVTRFFGFGSERIGSCDLDSPAGQAALAALTKDAIPVRDGLDLAEPHGGAELALLDQESVGRGGAPRRRTLLERVQDLPLGMKRRRRKDDRARPPGRTPPRPSRSHAAVSDPHHHWTRIAAPRRHPDGGVACRV
jgi:hypothetical protein